MCEHYGISDDVYRKRLENNWSLEKILLTPILKKHTKLIVYCKNFGLKYNRIYEYYKRHDVSEEEAILYYRPDLKLNLFGEIVEDIK